MVPRINLVWLLLLLLTTNCEEEGVSFNGFRGAGLSLNGSAVITSEGILRLTNPVSHQIGRAFYPRPLHFRSSKTGNVFSFSTTFVFVFVPENINGIGGHGTAFVISSTTDFHTATGTQFLGLFNKSNNGNSANRIFAVELDTIQNMEFGDIDDNHVGIDINSLRSNRSYSAGYFSDVDTSVFNNITLNSGEPMQVWVEYDSSKMQLNVTLSPMEVAKPSRPLLSSINNLSELVTETAYIGFSSSTGSFETSHYILGWNFQMNGIAQTFNLTTLPSLPPRRSNRKPKVVLIWVPIIAPISALLAAAAVVFVQYRRIKFAEVLDDWELELGSRRFSYKELYKATRGFGETQLLGVGGFGRVYRGIMPTSKVDVAVKRVAHDSKRGTREFIAEIASIGHLRHRNLVQLLGYCRRKRELLLVYDFMPNGSLDRFLFDHYHQPLNWAQRFHIIKDVASGLLYLHEEWEKTIIHRDVKASNVLLDSELNGRLGDFGLSRLYDHGEDPRTTNVVGTPGYIAPELLRTGKATKESDVFAFGAFLLEVACGKRPLQAAESGEDVVLVAWVLRNWRRGTILGCVDPRLSCDFVVEEAELVLKLGLLCSHHLPATRPSMKQTTLFMERAAQLPELAACYLDGDVVELLQKEVSHYRSMPSHSSSTDSMLFVGR
ncbi:hypothetical protein Taro_006312 [Colocasia esculenta]|uniref:non-specific serine/threonine protein kinase n=1 Tax=Colocasia esculenta TaxID=4460 RepID=A0A843TX07_COLES|nr:hypothetical protein [Colocasia esculenta]